MGWEKLTQEIVFQGSSCLLLQFFSSIDTVMFLFMVLKNNRVYCARGPMDHREFADLFIISSPVCMEICEALL